MKPVEIFERYLAVQRHFTSPSYNAIENKFVVKSIDYIYNKRKDRALLEFAARDFSSQNVNEVFVAALRNDPKMPLWKVLKDQYWKTAWHEWVKITNQLHYYFEKDLITIKSLLDKNNLKLVDVFRTNENKLPAIIRMYLDGIIKIETLSILESMFSFCARYNVTYKKDKEWKKVSRVVQRYYPLLEFDRVKYSNTFTNIFRPCKKNN